jgi:Zn-dependent metalloprotease
MKKIFILALTLLVYLGGGVFAQTSNSAKYSPKYLREDNKEFKNLTEKTTDNGWIIFKKESKLNPNNFFKDYANSLGLGQHYDFKSVKDETDNNKLKHQQFQLYYKNIPVEGAEFTLHHTSEIYS